jgi:hypothetical protein
MSGGGGYDPGKFVLVQSRAAWARQVADALDEITAANGGTEPATLRQCYDVAPRAFGQMIEALVALGAQVDAELTQLAGLRDIGEVI